MKAETSTDSFSQEGENESINDTFEVNKTLDYLPNELKFNTKYYNETADMILSGENNSNKQVVTEFFRGITLCHQANVVKDQ